MPWSANYLFFSLVESTAARSGSSIPPARKDTAHTFSAVRKPFAHFFHVAYLQAVLRKHVANLLQVFGGKAIVRKGARFCFENL
jgi:hypothetical protein